MKKTIYILASLTAVLFASCAKEADVIDDSLVAGTTLRASVEDVDTKVSANAAGIYNWQASDKIAVLDDAGTVYEFSAASAGATSEFSCASSITLGSYAAYPYSASFAASGDAVTFVIPSTITYSADATNMPMLGKISGDVVTFKAVGGLLKLIVYGVPSESTQLVFAAKAQKVSGNFAIVDASIEEPVIATAAKGASDNTITIDYTGKYSSNMVFYIPLPTGTIEGFDLTFNGTGSIHKSVTKDLVVARNGIILAPTLNMVTPTTLLSETFGTQSGENTYSMGSYDNSGTTVYGDGAVTYSTSGTVTLYTTKNKSGLSIANSPKTNEVLIGSSTGKLTIGNIPTAGASNAVISFQSNKNTTTCYAVSSPTTGVTVQTLTTSQITGTANPYTITLNISGLSGLSKFDLSISNTSGSNSRIDNITIRTAAPNPAITFTGTGTRTIAAESLTAGLPVTGVTLTGAVDGTGIGVDANVDWLTGTLSDGTLTISAKSYNHSKIDREGKIYLKATGATTQEITVTQKPTIVSAPTLATTAQDKSFIVSWTPDTKAGSYVAYYSTDDNLADPTTGTPLTIDTSGETYTASPSVDLVNGTSYTIYVRVNSVEASYAAVYGAPTDNWSKKNVTPAAAAATTYTWTLATGDLGTTGSPASSVTKGILSTTSSGIEWDLDFSWSGATKSFGWDGSNSRGVQVGTSTNKCNSYSLTTDDFTATITKIVVGANTASSGSATVSVTVGGSNFKCGGNNTASLNTTTTPTEYTFIGSGSGEIVITFTNSASKALYLKSIKINTD